MEWMPGAKSPPSEAGVPNHLVSPVPSPFTVNSGNDQNNNGECGNDGGDSAYFSYLQLRCLKIGTTYCVRIGGHGGSCDRDADRCPPLVSETTTPDELDADGCPIEQETSTVVVRKRSLESSESNLRKRDLQYVDDCQADKGPFKLVVQGLCVGSTGHSGDSGSGLPAPAADSFCCRSTRFSRFRRSKSLTARCLASAAGALAEAARRRRGRAGGTTSLPPAPLAAACV